MKLTIFFILLLIPGWLLAQNNFEGTVVYRVLNSAVPDTGMMEVSFGKNKVKTTFYTLKDWNKKEESPDYEIRDFIKDHHIRVNNRTRTIIIDTTGDEGNLDLVDQWKKTDSMKSILSYKCFKYTGLPPQENDSMQISSPDFWYSPDLVYTPPSQYLAKHKIQLTPAGNYLFLEMNFSDSLFGTHINLVTQAVAIRPGELNESHFTWPDTYAVVYDKIPEIEVKVEKVEETPQPPPPPPPPKPKKVKK